MKVLTIGGTGKVGRPLLLQLSSRGVELRAITRSPDRTAHLPPTAEAVVVDIVDDPDAALEAFRGVDAVFMLNAASERETVEGLLGVALAREAGVRRFVYQSVQHVEKLGHLPHIAPKLMIERAVRDSGMDFTILHPNYFNQNDDDCRYALMSSGDYVQPVGPVGCWRVDVRDIAEAAAVVLTTEGHGGRSYPVVGPQNMTGEDCAAVWGEALKKDVRYVGDIGAWQESVRPYIPAWLNYDLGLMYQILVEDGMQATPSEVAEMTGLLGRPPRSFESYAEDMAAEWAG